jgi:biotin carboxylase
MIEEWLEGPQISTETILHHEWAETPGFIDRNYQRLQEFAPHVIEDGGEQPSVLSPEDQRAIRAVAERAARALGIKHATAKGDLVFTKDGPKVIEMAARLSGGYMSSVQVPLATGVDLVSIAIRLATGEPVFHEECVPSISWGVAIRYCFAAPGRVYAVRGIEAVATLPGVQFTDLPVAAGDMIFSTSDHTQRAGCVIATGETRGEAVQRAEWAVHNISIGMEPAP